MNNMDYNKMFLIKNIQPSVQIVNYFTLDKSMGIWGPRIISDFEMIFIREGRFAYTEDNEDFNSFQSKYRINGKLKISLEPGDLLLIPPGVRHLFRAESKKGAISCIHNVPIMNLSLDQNKIKLQPTPEYQTSFSNDFKLMDNLFYKCNEIFTGYDGYREELLSTTCREIWLRCAAKWDRQFDNSELSDRMKLMLNFIKENCLRGIGRNELAEEFNLTAEYVNALFKEQLGMSPSECVNRERILLGYSKIYTEGLSIKEAAYESGFNDPLYFSRVFKKVLGVAPSTLRNKIY